LKVGSSMNKDRPGIVLDVLELGLGGNLSIGAATIVDADPVA